MGEVPGPRTDLGSEISEMSEEEVVGNNIVCELEEFSRHEMSVQDVLNVSGASLKRKRDERKRSDSDEQDVVIGDDGFTVVQKKNKKPKKASSNKNFRGYSSQPKTYTRRNSRSEDDLSSIEVCLSSTQVLPKQIGLAKLLKAEGIPNISEIKYKTPYKVLMKFETRADAEKLLSNSKFMELGYKSRLTNEVTLTYGLVRYIELEVQEEELMQSFSEEFEIASVKRLKRMTQSGEWSDSETVRFCFKSSTLPKYICGYDCRFKVEPYTFPVSQCSVCWKFGHLARMCPSSRKKCPKCSGEHENCDANEYTCANCKGNHMSFEKKCPVFLKEKEIRRVMCEQNCTYKVAYSSVMERHRQKKQSRESDLHSPEPIDGQELSQREVIVTEAIIHINKEVDHMDDSEDTRSSEDESRKTVTDNKQKKKNKNKQKSQHKNIENEIQLAEKNEIVKKSYRDAASLRNEALKEKKREDKNEQEQEKGQDKFSFSNMYKSLEQIFFSRNSFEDKVKLALKFLLDQVVSYFVGVISSGDIRKRMNLFHYG